MTQDEMMVNNGETLEPLSDGAFRTLEPVTQQSTSIVPVSGTPLHRCPTNLDLTTQRGKAMALRASSPGVLEVKDGEPLRMTCTAWIIIPDMSVDEKSGEMKEFARVTLFNERGQHFRTTAAHAPFRLKAMMEVFSQEEWVRGIPLIIEVRKSKRGTTYHDINIDVEALPK